MTRPSTLTRDLKIFRYYITGELTPKEIGAAMDITLWVVYKAVRRIRDKAQNHFVLDNHGSIEKRKGYQGI